MPARILVIEDNKDNLELMSYLLNSFGYTVLTAVNGKEGLEIARRQLPDLIICDIHLPEVDGYEVARHLKNHPALKAIPLIAVTALAMVGDRDKVLAAGFNAYISKPIDPETFVEQVKTLLQPDQLSKTPPPAATVETLETLETLDPTQVLDIQAMSKGKGITILVVDDSPINLRLAASILEPFGYHIITAKDVKEALALIRQQVPDLILCDIHMPNASGYDLIKAVKADPQWSRIPFLFISSTIWPDREQANISAWDNVDLILRPLDPQELIAKLETALQKARKE